MADSTRRSVKDDFIDRASDELVAGIAQSASEDVPDGLYRDFLIWSLSRENPKRSAFLQLMGIPQLIRLSCALLDGMLDSQQIEQTLRVIAPLNIYLSYEVVSDNLSIGLGSPLKGDPTRAIRRAVLETFNAAMVERLKGSPTPARTSLAPMFSDARQISCFRQSLSPDKYRALVQAYLEHRPGSSLGELEHSIWPQLVANVEACARASRAAALLRVGAMVKWGLINRYRAVGFLLEDGDTILSRRILNGADAILVVPVLAHYVGVVAEIVHPAEGVAEVVQDGSLGELLFTAAVLTRLLNDVGTTALRDADARTALFLALRQQCAASNASKRSFSALLLDNVQRFGAVLTRLDKDLSNGEFNVALSGLTERPAVAALCSFEERIQHFASLYTQSYDYFEQCSARVEKQLSDHRVVRIIRRLVQFHEQLYSHSYTSSEGEYAIAL